MRTEAIPHNGHGDDPLSPRPAPLVAASPVDLARIIWAGWPIVLAAIVLTVALTAAYVFFVAEKKYTATGAIMIEPPADIYPATTGVPQAANLDKSAIVSQAEALQSRDLLQAVNRKLSAEGLITPNDTQQPVDPVESLKSALSISVVDDSHVIKAEFTDSRPEFAERTLGLLFDEYIRREIERKSSINAAARDQYAARADSLRTELESLNQRIADQTARTGRHFEGGTTVLFGSMQTAVNQLDELQAELADVDARINVVNDALDSGDASSAVGVLESANVRTIAQTQLELELQAQALRAEGRGEQHPDSIALQKRSVATRRLLTEEMNQALRELGDDRRRLLAQSRQQQQRIAVLQAGSDRESQGMATLEQLEKSAEALREMLNQVVGRLYDTAVTPHSNAWVIAAPTAQPDPTSPNVAISLAGAVLMGTVGGALATFWRERKRRAASAVLDIYPVATAPSLWQLPPPRRRLLSSRDRRPEISNATTWRETLRAIGHRLTAASKKRGGITVAIVSAQPREGKTMIAISLARTLAEDGYRVLLVDGDLRKPDIHHSVQVRTEGSLHSMLHDSVDWRDLVQCDASSRLHVLAPTEASDPPTGLLRDDHLRRVLDSAKQYYDFVVVDTSPVLRVADGLFLLDFVDSTILVSGEQTDPRETQRVLTKPGFPLTKVEGVIRFGLGTGSLSYPGY